ncbi:MAG TPA: hypothetical protein VFW45_18645 [Candidatus Polarisedimenticolia bacterium]|nr:hypothetical protein [Candidatus Polarisedimenticolia bacterium]
MSTAGPEALRRIARIALIAGAIGSFGLMLYHGRYNKHLLITAMFTVWVGAPFASLALADRLSDKWPARVRRTLHAVTLLVAFVSLAIYAMDAVWPRQAQAAFYYVAVPPITWLASAMVLGAAAFLSKPSSSSEDRRPEVS